MATDFLAEKSGNISDDMQKTQHNSETEDADRSTGSGIDDSDDYNEFLNSSSFLSNSQIIRSTNVANFTASQPNYISSPVRRVKEVTPPPVSDPVVPPPSSTSTQSTKTKEHFRLLMNQRSSTIEETHTFIDDEPDDTTSSDKEIGSDDHKTTKFIDIDDPRATPKLPKMHPDATPWRRLRPQSTIRTREIPGTLPKPDVTSIHYVQSLFDSNFESNTETTASAGMGKSPLRSASLFESGGSSEIGATTANLSYELENLRKQVTNYKLHQRVLMELIRNLVASSGMKSDDLKKEIMDKLERENEFLFNERQNLQKELQQRQPSEDKPDVKQEQKYNDKMKEIVELKNDLISARNQCTELTAYVDELKAQLAQYHNSDHTSTQDRERWTQLLNNILTILLRMTNGDSAKAVEQARDTSKSIDTKLNVVKLALSEIMEQWNHNQAQNAMMFNDVRNAENETPGDLKTQFRDKLNISKNVEHELKGMLRQQSELVSTLRAEHSSLQKQFRENAQFTASLKKLLAEKRAKVTELNERVLELEAQNEELEDSRGSGHQEKEAQLLKSRLTIVKSNHAKEVEKLHFEIESLQMKCEELSRRADDKKLLDDLARKQNYINQLNDEIATLNSRLLSSNRDHEAEVVKIQSLLQDARDDFEGLVREYNTLQQEFKEIQEDRLAKERDYRRKLEHAAKELNLAVTKQRALGAEKSKLTYAYEELKRERNNLGVLNGKLNEKVSRLTYDLSKVAHYEVGFNSIFELQRHHIKNMLDDFEPLLEKESYTQAKQKLDKLSDTSLDIEMTHSVVRSLLAFFENAMSSLIADHRELMDHLDQLDDEAGNDKQLKEEVESLQKQLQWYNERFNNGELNGAPQSPRTQLRIEDLQKKFKAERERRSVEYEQSQQLVGKLEQENRELKEELERLRGQVSAE